MTCWRCQEPGHPYWMCMKVIDGVAGQGAGGPAWAPPGKGKGKDSSTKGDKGSKGKGKGDQPGKGKGDSVPNQLRWKPRDRFLESLTADGKAKYIEYLKEIKNQVDASHIKYFLSFVLFANFEFVFLPICLNFIILSR